MSSFTIFYDKRLLIIKTENRELSIVNLKNKILSYFENIFYEDLELYLSFKTKLYELYDDDIVGNHHTYVVKIVNK